MNEGFKGLQTLSPNRDGHRDISRLTKHGEGLDQIVVQREG